MGSELSVTDEEGTLGMLMENSMKVPTECASAVKKVNSMLATIRKGIENKIANIIMPMYRSMVKPHLEYCGHQISKGI